MWSGSRSDADWRNGGGGVLGLTSLNMIKMINDEMSDRMGLYAVDESN